MTPAEFRALALSFSKAVEASHVGHPDFRVRGRIFATLGYPDDAHGVLMLTPDEQQEAIGARPDVFAPVNGAWGRRGNTLVLLDAIATAGLRPWMDRAHRKVSAKSAKRRDQ